MSECMWCGAEVGFFQAECELCKKYWKIRKQTSFFVCCRDMYFEDLNRKQKKQLKKVI
mgnify:CR=1 FL=1